MVEYLIIGFLAGLIAHYHYLLVVHRVQLEIDLFKIRRLQGKEKLNRRSANTSDRVNTRRT